MGAADECYSSRSTARQNSTNDVAGQQEGTVESPLDDTDPLLQIFFLLCSCLDKHHFKLKHQLAAPQHRSGFKAAFPQR